MKRLGLTAVAIVTTLLLVEGGLRLVGVTDDVRYTGAAGYGLQLAPRQEGTYRRCPARGGDPILSHFRVNNVGFNNLKDYSIAHTKPVRVAVVGDSFVEALHIDVDKAFFAVLEEQLIRGGLDAEVYSFGVSGFGTAQVLHLIEGKVEEYMPDYLIYLFIPNDLSDSTVLGDRADWTPQYDLDKEGRLRELAHGEYRLTWPKRVLRSFALTRYLYYERRLGETLLAGPAPGGQGQQGPDEESRERDQLEERAWQVMEKLLQRLDDEMHRESIPWLLVWMGSEDRDYYRSIHVRLEEIARRDSLPFFDLDSAFRDDHLKTGRRYRYRGDGHWNEAGHRVAGEALAAPVLAWYASAVATPP